MYHYTMLFCKYEYIYPYNLVFIFSWSSYNSFFFIKDPKLIGTTSITDVFMLKKKTMGI